MCELSVQFVYCSSTATVDTAAASVTMMQIDCEVLDTRLVELNERDIPSHLRQAKAPVKNAQHKNFSDEGMVFSLRALRVGLGSVVGSTFFLPVFNWQFFLTLKLLFEYCF